MTPDWQSEDGAIELHHADCLERMTAIPDGAVDMILADLPYGTTACKWDTVIPFEPLWKHYKRIIKRNGAIVLTASQPFTSALVMSNPGMFRYSLIWDKGVSGSFANAESMPLRTHEDICVFCAEKPRYFPQKMKRDRRQMIGGVRSQSTVGGRLLAYNSALLDENKTYSDAHPKSVMYFSPRADKDRGLHQTQKPIDLIQYLLLSHTEEGETVLDNTMGSGTTMVACLNTGRRGIGIEKDAEIYATAQDRVESAIRAKSEQLTFA